MKSVKPPSSGKRTEFRPDPTFHVALSFAGEDRKYVEKTADVLRRMGFRVFYDKYEQVSLWGKNLYDHLSEVYGKTSRYTVMFISKHYAKTLWTNLERQSAQAKAFSEQKEYLLPVRFDNTDIPGIHSTVGYIDLEDVSPAKLAELIKQKIGPIIRDNFMPDSPDRLLAFLGVKAVAAQRVVTSIAKTIFDDFLLMTPEERRLLSVIAVNTCPTGPAVDNDMHININLLARLSGIGPRKAISLCSRLECFGFCYKVTSHDLTSKNKNILRLTYEPSRVAKELSGNLTRVVHGIFMCIADLLCPDCRLNALDRMDFSVLSTLAGFPESHKVRRSRVRTRKTQ